MTDKERGRRREQGTLDKSTEIDGPIEKQG